MNPQDIVWIVVDDDRPIRLVAADLISIAVGVAVFLLVMWLNNWGMPPKRR